MGWVLSGTIANALARKGLSLVCARCVAVAGAIVLLGFTIWAYWPIPKVEKDLPEYLVLIAWLFAPPAWFLFEYHLWRYERSLENEAPPPVCDTPRAEQAAPKGMPVMSFEEIKYAQELASKWWAAVLALIIILLTA